MSHECAEWEPKLSGYVARRRAGSLVSSACRPWSLEASFLGGGAVIPDVARADGRRLHATALGVVSPPLAPAFGESTRLRTEPWLGIELRHFAALAAVAHEASFRGAARRLGYVASAVSAQVAALERAVGVRLIERTRGPGPVRLTRAGAIVLDHSDAIFARLRTAQRDLRAYQEGDAGAVDIGLAGFASREIFAEIAKAWQTRHPGVALRPHYGAADEVALLLERGDVDGAVTDAPPPTEGLTSQELVRDVYVLIAPKAWQLRNAHETVTGADLAGVPIIGAQPLSARANEATFQLSGTLGGVDVRADDEATMYALVRAGVGAAFVPRLSARATDDVDVIPVADGSELAPYVLFIVWNDARRSAPPFTDLVTSFEEFAREVTSK
jgi:DNA-binding transcriptional LysR family regulator